MASEDVVERVAAVLADHFDAPDDLPYRTAAAEDLQRAGLLADPAQTTELEKLRASRDAALRDGLEAADRAVSAEQRAASWWEAAKTLNRWGTAHRELHRSALAERDERQARIDAALQVLDEPAPVLPRTDPHFERMNARNARTQLVQRVRAALAGDQPTPGPACYPPVDGWNGESIVTPPDPSGRIVDGGPVTPFTDTGHQEQPDA